MTVSVRKQNVVFCYFEFFQFVPAQPGYGYEVLLAVFVAVEHQFF